MFERIKHIIIKEFIQSLRDKKMRFVMFVMPVVQLIIFCYACSTDVKIIPTAIYDSDKSIQSRELIREFVYSKYFEIKKDIDSFEEQKDLLDRSIVNTVIRINSGFGNEIHSSKPAVFQVIVDGTDSNTAMYIQQYAKIVAHRYAKKTGGKDVQANSTNFTPGNVDLLSRAWFNENLQSRNFYVPGIIVLVVFIVTLLLTAMAIVNEKELGTIEQLMVSPIRGFELIVGKLIPFAFVGIIDIFVITILALILFDIPLRGNIFVLFVSTCLFLLNSLGLGLLISTVSKTQQESLMMTFFVAMPCSLLSGFVFPISNMPKIIQLFTYFNPLQYFLIIVRSIFLKGLGFKYLWPHMLALFVLGISILFLSSLLFNKKLE